jgi:transcriptional regulator with XRE-family HTH domain
VTATPTSSRLIQIVRENVRRLRHEQSLTQEELADQSTISRTYLGYLESTGKNVSLEILEKLASALDVDPRELLKPQDEWDDS